MKYSLLLVCFFCIQFLKAQHFEATAIVVGNNIEIRLKAIGGDINCGWSDIEFFFRQNNSAPIPGFGAAAIMVNSADFSGVSIPYNGMNMQGAEESYRNFWFGTSFSATTPKTYNAGQEYLLCTIQLGVSALGYGLELVHNQNYVPTYLSLTDQGGNDRSNASGNVFFGAGAVQCNCPVTTAGVNHLLPLAAPLPLELLRFEAEKNGPEEVFLYWRSSKNDLIYSFDIQRSNGGNWETIGTVEAREAWEFRDKNPLPGLSYYRLLILEASGETQYSPQRAVRFNTTSDLLVFPNPANKQVMLHPDNQDQQEQLWQLQLQDLQGRLIASWRLELSREGNTPLEFPWDQLPSGSYRLTMKQGDRAPVQKLLLIQH